MRYVENTTSPSITEILAGFMKITMGELRKIQEIQKESYEMSKKAVGLLTSSIQQLEENELFKMRDTRIEEERQEPTPQEKRSGEGAPEGLTEGKKGRWIK